MRIALYARFSTDLQSASSLEDQFRLCESRIDGTVVARHGDDGLSGSIPVDRRPGGRQMLADAMAGRFDVLVVESLDRLSRDTVELERVIRRLEHRSIRVVGISDGYDSQAAGRKVIRAVRGIVAELYLDDLRAKTHRGLTGKIERGFIASGRSYGYDIEKRDGGSVYRINEDEARWVRHVFRMYAEGQGPQRIVYDLNKAGVPSARGGAWAVSAVYGNPREGSGLLNNRLYVGELIWNRSQWLKDPDTGKRQRIMRPASEWMVRQAPDLRIIDDGLWHAVRARIDSGRMTGRRPFVRPHRSLFGGVLLCPYCRSPLVAISATRYGCLVRKDRGPDVCQGFTLSRDATDQRLLASVRDMLTSPEVVIEFERAIAALRPEKSGKRLESLDAEIGRLVDAIARVGMSDALAKRLREAEDERRRLGAWEPKPVRRNPQAVLNQILLKLRSALAEDPERARAVIGKIVRPTQIRIRDGFAEAELDTGPIEELAMGGSTAVVAGAGFHCCRRVILRKMP